MKEFLKSYAKSFRSELDFKRIKVIGIAPLDMICDRLSEVSNISEDEITKLSTDEKTVEYIGLISVINSILVVKMCRIYYTIVGIIIGIITSLLFGYFMG